MKVSEDINVEFDNARTKFHALREKLEKIKEKQEYEQGKKNKGKCYVYINSYGSTASWPLYSQIVDVVKEGLVIESYEFTSHNRVEIKKETTWKHEMLVGYKPISLSSFIRGRNSVLKRIGLVKKK